MLRLLKGKSALIGIGAAFGSVTIFHHTGTNSTLLNNSNNLVPSKKKSENIDYIIKKLDPIEEFHAPKNPVVLCHGLSGFSRLILLPSVYQITKFFRNFISLTKDDQQLMHNIYDDDDDPNYKAFLEIDYWIGVKAMLEAQHVTVFTAKVPPFGSIDERAYALNDFIKAKIFYMKHSETVPEIKDNDTKVKVNLIAHSMGGLDARYLISAIPPEEKENYEVLSLTTISTPHHGSVMADYVCNLFDDLKFRMGIQNPNVRLPTAFYQLTTDYVNLLFNKQIKDDPKVKYFSYGAYFNPSWNRVFYFSWKTIMNLSNEPNDGLVTVASSKHGEFRGVLPNLDHLSIINWNVSLTGKKDPNAIDILQFYMKVVDDLGRCGC
ncbi:hypothetical protein ACO0QE_002208 [Hanseniaspora vineae]